MKKGLYFLTATTALLLTYGCQRDARSNASSEKASEKIEVVERILEPFKRVIIKGSKGKVYLKQGDKEFLKIEADENLIGLFSATVENDTLTIEQKLHSYFSDAKTANFYITVKNLDSLSLYGRGEIVSEGPIKFERAKINVSGTGKLDLDLQGQELVVKMLGASQAKLRGKIDNQKVAINGAGTYDALDLETNETYLSLNGSSNASVNVKDDLVVKIFGSGTVKYKGKPEIEQSVSGSGTIESLDKNEKKAKNE